MHSVIKFLNNNERGSSLLRSYLVLFLFQLLFITIIQSGTALPSVSDVLYVEDDEPIVTNIRDGQYIDTTISERRTGRESQSDINNNEQIPDNLIKLNKTIDKQVIPETVIPEDIDDFNQTNSSLSTELDNSTFNETTTTTESDVLSKVTEEGRILYNGAQVWKLKLSNVRVLAELNHLNMRREIGWWGGNISYIDMMVKPNSRQYVHDLLTSYSVPYEVVIEDLQRAIDVENPEFDEDLEFANRKGHRMTWQSYHRLSDIHGYLDYLANTYPDLCSVKTIGTSVRGQPLKMLKISNGKPDNKAIWIDGGMHAREWISPASVTYIINHIVENYENESSDIKNIDWYFHPVANPDGYEHTHTSDRLWRKNRARSGVCAGVDLNRNFGYRWGGKGSSRNPCTETYAGQSAFSEPESRAIKNFFETTKANFKSYISFHSYGQYILYPWGYDNVVPPDYKDLQTVGQKIAQAMRQTGGGTYKVGAAANTLYPAAGGSDDWAKGSRKIKYSYTIELRDTGRYGFVLPSTLIIPTAKEALSAIRVVAGAEELESTKTKLNNESQFHAIKPGDKTLQQNLDRALENLKDLQEHNTALQLQLDTLNKSHQVLKACNEELTNTNKTLERRLIENEALIKRLKNELRTLQERYTQLQNTENLLKKTVEHQKNENKNLKQQNDKDTKSIQDLTRQVKEMERIITRKHPDSVSALILAANTNSTIDTSNQNARQILEERIKQLEAEAKERDLHSTKIFSDIQEKFNTMKQKYESHIEDLEKHVTELKTQINSNIELINQETQTYLDTNRNVNYAEIAVQTINNKIPKLKRSTEKLTSNKEDSHLLATIRGLNQDITNKERQMLKLQKEMDELRRTNRRLQKERECTLKTNNTGKEYNPNEYRIDYDSAIIDNAGNLENMNIQYGLVRDEKEKLIQQLARLEEDYQMLKLKRLQDLNTLQEAHEQELTNYMGKMAPLREQLEVQQVTIKKLQQQLANAREQVAVLTVERDHLDTRLKSLRHLERQMMEENQDDSSGVSEYAILRRKITQLERRYEERELRLHAIVQGLAQKQSMNSARDCEQCAIRQQQLCSYKAELDQVLSTLRNHTNL